MIAVKNYTLQVGDFRLQDVTMDIKDGEIFAILGQTGSGKTVLLESMAGFYEEFSGGILYDGPAGTQHTSAGSPPGLCLSGFRIISSHESESKYRIRPEDKGDEAGGL